MAKKTPTRWQGYTWADCDCKLCLYYGGKSKGSVKCLAGDCVCKEERADALIRDQAERPIKYAYIYFKENMKPGSSRARKDKIAIELEPTFQKLSFYDMKRETPDSIFRCWNHDRYGELLQIFRDWVKAGIDASTVERFETPKGWDDWRKTVFFEDKDVHWQVLIEYNNGTCAAYVHRNVLFPKELRQIYEVARSMNPGK